ncbi:MAG: polysaccharide biosynthesis tyrosine autokinase [Rubripirellula sp.]|nr:polysaccharide biosynthesis tyrosine autokinase [Rubripirellula sp.]
MISNVQQHQASSGSNQSAGRPRSPHAPEIQFDPWILWVAFRRCWPWAIPLGAILAGLVAFYILETFVPKYQARHLLEANDDFVVFKGVMPTVADLARSEKEIFYNSVVLDPVLADSSLRKAPSLSDPETAEKNIRKNLKLSSAGGRNRIFVSYTDIDRDAAAKVCNAIVESYMRQRDSFDDARISNLEKWLEPEIERWQQEVEVRQTRIQKLSEMTLGYSVLAQGPVDTLKRMETNADISLVAKLRGEISDLLVQISLLDAQEQNQPKEVAVESAAEFVPPELIVQRIAPTEAQILLAINRDSELIEIQQRIAKYKSTRIGLEDQDLVRLRREYYEELGEKIAEQEARIETVKEEARPRVIEKLEEQADLQFQIALDERDRQIELMREEFERNKVLGAQKRQMEIESAAAGAVQKRNDLEVQLASVRKQYTEEMSRLEQFGGASAELQFAQEDLAVANSVLSKLRSRAAAIRTERRQDGAVRSLAIAVPPKSPTESVPTKQIIVGAGAAFVVPFFLGLLWEFRIQRVTDCKKFESTALTTVVGEVAKLPSGARNGGRGRRMFEESVDSLRANLFLSLQTKNTRSIAVVSSMSAEGKSSVSSQLALSISKATGETVLLIDADMRCPDQHDIFGLEMGPGLSRVLSKEVELMDAVDKSLGSMVHVLPAGQLNCSPHRLMSESAVQELLDESLEHYSIVIFDTAPVLAAGETLAIASAVDTTLLCVMRDVSRMENVSRTTRRLEAAGANVAGTVFSGVSARQYAYRYGDYHYASAIPDQDLS